MKEIKDFLFKLLFPKEYYRMGLLENVLYHARDVRLYHGWHTNEVYHHTISDFNYAVMALED